MKKQIYLVVIILGAMLLQSCYSYRIKVVKTLEDTYYTPQRRILGGWETHFMTLTTRVQAERVTKKWRREMKSLTEIKRPKYIRVK